MRSDAPLTGDSLLEQVLDRIDDRSGALSEFARAYLQRLPYGVDMEAESAFREIANLFDFIQERSGPVDVRVYDPDQAVHGYTAPGTVVEVWVDDAPFLVDSVTAELLHHGLEVVRVLHPVIGVERTPEGRLLDVVKASDRNDRESVQHYVLDRHLDPSDQSLIEGRVRAVLQDVLAAVRDFSPMAARTAEMEAVARGAKGHYPDADIEEAVAFLRWLGDDNFVFLGYREYSIVDLDGEPALVADPESGLGILSDPSTSRARQPVLLAELPAEVQARYREGGLLVVTKTNRMSTVHRRARMDYIGVRRLADDGSTIGELRLLGLFTSKAYMESVSRIPLLRRKLADVTSTEGLIAGSHDHKAVVTLVESFPKDELFGLPSEDLRRVILGLLALQEPAGVRLFVRRDLLDRGVRILVALPRERYTAELRRRLQDLFVKRFGGTDADHHLSLDRGDLARLHFTVWIPEGDAPEVDFAALEAEVLALARTWEERLTAVLAERRDEALARRLVDKWATRLPTYYKASTEVAVAAGDIEHLEALESSDDASRVGVQNELEGTESLTRITLYERVDKRPLSELTPALENMGLTVVEEVPTRVDGDDVIFLHDFGVLGEDGDVLEVSECGDRVARTLQAIWDGEVVTDSLDRLVLVAGLEPDEVAILRAYETYWRRVNPIFTVNYVNEVLAAHPDITAGLVRLFSLKFDPGLDGTRYEDEKAALVRRVEQVPSLDADRILRGFLRLIDATTRTNAYVSHRRSLALKLRSEDVPDMPSPRPRSEIFVIAPEVEGIHLRAGLRARGGIRWSERKEDYRTEVLGLMKAQVTKNAIIVPTGAKGGFVVRGVAAPTPDDVAAAYAVYIRGLLDLTDNLVEGKVVPPSGVRAHDGDDPYMVVAADRGTARLSDVANGIAAEYGFWLDDAFASGGATGYDHKELGITARGAWKSLERHFFGLGIDPHNDPFTAVGIGDMSGDVFGNGMLQSDRIRLIAAFDHRHIFLDPDPDPGRAFEERRRLFELPGSSWDDYNRSAISEGGGVYSRTVKKIELSEAARAALGTSSTTVTPAELIQIILQAPVDLIWNGGIGTYVKASTETHDQVGDRANDPVRIDASDVRARVVVEGGNLGLTHRARIEMAGRGVLVNADFIDNSAGVHCSDREVNLKILLRMAEERGDLTRSERDRLLLEASDEVVAAILRDNLAQAHRLALDESECAVRLDAFDQLISDLENRGFVDREEDVLPDPDEMRARARDGKGLTRPELAVVLAQAKRALAEDLVESDVPDDPSLVGELREYFPSAVVERFGDLLWGHPLRRELVATILANELINTQGPTFVSRLVRRRGVSTAQAVAAYRSAREVVGQQMRRRMEDEFGRVDPDVWREMIQADSRLVSVLTRWCLRRPTVTLSGEAVAAGLAKIEEKALDWGALERRAERRARFERLKAAGLPPDLALRTAVSDQLVHGPDILEVADSTGRSVPDVGTVFHQVGQAVWLDALEDLTTSLTRTDHWQRWAIQTVEDDLMDLRRSLAESILRDSGAVDSAVQGFRHRHRAELDRIGRLVASLAQGDLADVTPLVVAVRQIESLVVVLAAEARMAGGEDRPSDL